MTHYQIDILLIHAAVVNQDNAPVGRNALHDPPCRGAVMQEIARKTRLSVPLPQLAALFEEFGFSRRFHEMDRKRFVALRANLPEKGILHGVDRVRGQRGFGIAEQTPLLVRRVSMQPEDFGESTVRQAAAGFYGKGRIPVGYIAYGLHPLRPHPGVGRSDGRSPLLFAELSPHPAHRPGESGEAAALGNSAPQVGEFQVAMDIDKSRNQDSRVKFDTGSAVRRGARFDGFDASVGPNRHQRVFNELPPREEVVGGYPAKRRRRIHRRRF